MDHYFTCISCSVIFDDAEVQRSHYKTDWHRYNLKRKIAELPPVTHGEFENKVELQRQKKEEKVQDHTALCNTCNKNFSSANALDNHLKSKKHKEAMIKSEKQENTKGKEPAKKSSGKKIKPKPGFLPPLEGDEIIDGDSDEWEDVENDEDMDGDDVVVEEENINEESEALPQSFCLFCPHESVSLVDNFRHMTKSHSFFIPDLQYVTNLEALFVYLGAKVGDGKVCLYCNNHSKQFQSVRACQKHMVDKGHCILDYDGDAILEYADFYDFSASYPDNKEVTDTDSEISLHEGVLSIDPDTMELILPSGARAGHRALRRYYNQNPILDHLQQRNRPMIAAADHQCKVLGLNERTLSVALRKRLVARKSENKYRARHMMQIGVKANKLQPFFRLQYGYCG